MSERDSFDWGLTIVYKDTNGRTARLFKRKTSWTWGWMTRINSVRNPSYTTYRHVFDHYDLHFTVIVIITVITLEFTLRDSLLLDFERRTFSPAERQISPAGLSHHYHPALDISSSSLSSLGLAGLRPAEPMWIVGIPGGYSSHG